MKRQYPMFAPEDLTPETFVHEAIRNHRAVRLLAIWRPTLVEYIRRHGPEQTSHPDWLRFFERAPRNGVSLDELRYSRVEDWLMRCWTILPIPRRAVLDYLDENGLGIHVVQRREISLNRPTFLLADPDMPDRWHSSTMTDEATGSRFGLQVERGGLFDPPELQGRWLLRLRLPNEQKLYRMTEGAEPADLVGQALDSLNALVVNHGNGLYRYRDETLSGGRHYRDVLFTIPGIWPPFASPHFPVSNVLCHVRLTERTCEAGRALLHVEELQSDWHNPRSGRPAPFRRQWMRIALQWCLQEAAALGFDGVSLTPGDILVRRNLESAAAFLTRTYRQAERALRGLLPEEEGSFGTATYRCSERSLQPEKVGGAWVIVDRVTGLGVDGQLYPDHWSAKNAATERQQVADHVMPALLLRPGAREVLDRRWFDRIGGDLPELSGPVR